MTLDQAIEHAFEKANDKKCSKDCRADHAQLAQWLKELKKLKAEQPVKRYSWDDTHPNYEPALKRPLRSGKFPVAFKYTDDNGKRHWKTGWYSNRSNFIDDFSDECHGSDQL